LGECVYNPFDLLFLFSKRQFGAYWFETGAPMFLVKLLLARQASTPDLTRLHASEALLSTFDVDTMGVEALMFQTGYLTIGSTRSRPGAMDIILRYPNLEVEASLNQTLLTYLTQTTSEQAAQTSRLYDLPQVNDFDGLRELFHAFYASIPHDGYRKNQLARYEDYYASIFYSHFSPPWGWTLPWKTAATRVGGTWR